jgi:hypothetical protein
MLALAGELLFNCREVIQHGPPVNICRSAGTAPKPIHVKLVPEARIHPDSK